MTAQRETGLRKGKDNEIHIPEQGLCDKHHVAQETGQTKVSMSSQGRSPLAEQARISAPTSLDDEPFGDCGEASSSTDNERCLWKMLETRLSGGLSTFV